MRLKSFFTALLTIICTTGVNAQDPAGPVLTKELRSKDPVFYSNARMYVGPNTRNADEAIMFISGSASFANQAEIIQEGITSLTGDFVSVKYLALVPPLEVPNIIKSLFFAPQQFPTGKIRFVGQWNKQTIRRGEVYLDSGNPSIMVAVDDKLTRPEYELNFPTIEVRKEGVKELQELANLTADQGWYKPWVVGDEKFSYKPLEYGVVNVATNIAIRAESLDVTGGNRFAVDVVSDALDPYGDGYKLATPAASDYYKLNTGFANIRGIVEEAGKVGGYHEIDMTKLYTHTDGMNGMHSTNPELSQAQEDPKVLSTNTISLGGGKNATFMRGFTSPFDKLRTDYMFYHVLTAPNAASITSGLGPIAAPDMEFTSGQGYFQAMDVSGAYFEKIDDLWTTDHKMRHRGGYNLSRLAQEWYDRKKDIDPVTGKVTLKNERNNLGLFTISDTDAQVAMLDGYIRPVEEQRFNVGNVEVELYKMDVPNTSTGGGKPQSVPGVNFLANPYMTPISLNSILLDINGDETKLQEALTALGSANDTQKSTPFATGSVGGAKVKAIHKLDYNNPATQSAIAAGDVLIRSAYWLINSAFVANVELRGLPFYAYNVKYDFVDLGSSAKTVDAVQNRYIEPMQMFLLQVANGGTFTFSTRMKANKGKRFPTMLSSFNPTAPLPVASARAAAAASEIEEEDQVVVPDWFVVEAVVGNDELTVDRTAVRFFETASLGYDAEHDQIKNLRPLPYSAATKASRSTSRVGDIGEEIVPKNVIYTRNTSPDVDMQDLLANCVNYTTKEIPLHYIPGDATQNVTFTVHGLDGLDRVQGVWLIDREKNTKQDLLRDNEYSFISEPVANALEADNRFILRFYDDEEGPSVTEKPITCYYSGSTLHIGGLNEKDLGSIVHIFDLQGRMMGNTTITNQPSMEYHKTLGQGTFIVKIIGERNYTTKFVNIQNY